MRRRVLLGLAAALLTAGGDQAAAAQAAVPQAPDPLLLGASPIGLVRDALIGSRAAVRVTPAAPPFGGTYTTPSGETVRVLESPSYDPAPDALQAWANYFASLPHGPELAQLTVYLAPLAEITAECGAEDDLSCYDPAANRILLVGSQPPGEDPIEEIAAHEYGHHIANHRDNDPWSAEDYGPKYWSTYEHVCQGVGSKLFPGDETADTDGGHYLENPGENWAETYRILAGGTAGWSYDPDLEPDAGALAAARRDVLTPWTGDEYTDAHGRLPARGSRWRYLTFPLENDGTSTVQLTSSRGLDADLYIFDPSTGKRLSRSAHDGGAEHLTTNLCGYRHLRVGVYRYRGSGTFRIRATLPYNTTR